VGLFVRGDSSVFEDLYNPVSLRVVREGSLRVSSGGFDQPYIIPGQALAKVWEGLISKVLAVEEVKCQPAEYARKRLFVP
jgi:hypothetical protein